MAVRYELGRWYLRNGQAATGVGWLVMALRADPRHAPTHAALAGYFEGAGQPQRAALHRAAAAAPAEPRDNGPR